MSEKETESGLSSRGRMGVGRVGVDEVSELASERDLLAGRRRRLQRSADWSMRLAMILLGILALLILVSWWLGW